LSTCSSPELNLQLRERKIDVVMNDEEPFSVDVLVPNQGSDRLTTLVHEGARQGENGAGVADPQGGNISPDAETRTLEPHIRRNGLNNLGTDVVARAVVTGTGVP
jgi:hypothetical protein